MKWVDGGGFFCCILLHGVILSFSSADHGWFRLDLYPSIAVPFCLTWDYEPSLSPDDGDEMHSACYMFVQNLPHRTAQDVTCFKPTNLLGCGCFEQGEIFA